MVVKILRKHKISAIHDFFCPAVPFVLEVPENEKNHLGQNW